MKKAVCENCWNKSDCEVPCSALEELYRFKRDQNKKETRKIIQELRKLLETKDCEMAEDLQELATSVIDEHREELGFIEDMEIQVGFVRSYKRKIKDGRIILADTEKTKYKYTAYLPYDFIITFYEPNVEMLTDEQKRTLMWHELRHIGIGEKGYKIVPHDIEEFFSIINKCGLNWSDMSSGNWL